MQKYGDPQKISEIGTYKKETGNIPTTNFKDSPARVQDDGFTITTVIIYIFVPLFAN